MDRRLLLYPVLLILFTSCAERGFQEPLASIQEAPATTTYSPPEPTSRKIGVHKVVEGLSQISDLKLSLDGATARTSLKGIVGIKTVSGEAVNVPFEVAGVINSEDYMAFMTATNHEELKTLNLKVGAKLTCLDTSCSESFIDIYINYKGYVYHHQVEARGNKIPEPEAPVKGTPSKEPVPETPKPKDSQPTPSPTPKIPTGEGMKEDDDGSQYEHEIDDDSEAGTYVGEPQKDLEVLFPDTSSPEEGPTPKDPKQDDKKENTPPKQSPTPVPSTPNGNDSIKGIAKRFGQAVTALGKNNFVRGHLENATNIWAYELKNPNVGFHILYPKREAYYGTDDMLAVLAYMGRFNNQRIKGYVSNIGDISRKNGGKLGSHSSHQMGLDADIAYYFNAKEKQKGLADAVSSSKAIPGFMAEEQWEMFKALVEQGNVDRIFIHPVLKKEICDVAQRKGDWRAGIEEGLAFEALRVLRSESHHDDHFHLRLKCSTAQPRCRQMAPPNKQADC